MPSEWYLIDRPLYNSGYEQNEFDNYATDAFAEYLSTAPQASAVELCNSDLTVRTAMRAVVQNKTADGTTSPLLREILSAIGTLSTGKYIYTNSTYWLIVTQPDNNGMYEKASAKLCNLLLKWQNVSGTIVERYCHVVNETSYGTGEEFTKPITTTSSEYNILIPLDDETVLLNHNNRFLIDVQSSGGIKPTTPASYRIKQRDVMSNKYPSGTAINFTLTKEEYNPETDNATLMIADYTAPVTPPSPLPSSITPTDGKITMGFAKTFTVVFRDANGATVTGLTPIWSLSSAVTGLTDYITLVADASRQTATLTVDDNYDLAESAFTLSVTESTGTYSASISLVIGGLF